MKPSGEPWLIGLAAVVVAAITFVFRFPSCGESFWLDELHSAWAVAGSFDQVAGRAARGNQTTGYFHMLWVWQSMVGPSEVAMRMSSVLASCLTAGCLVAGVAWRTRRLAGGLVAGGMFAIDPNAVFFGCELRSYSFVMLYAALAALSAMIWLGRDGAVAASRSAGESLVHSYGGARWRLAMLFWICVAALVHPTSLGVLAWLVPLTAWIAWKTGRMTLWRADWFAAVVVVGTLGALAVSSLPDSWQQRDLWRAFGQATQWRQLAEAWDWLPILGVPFALASLSWFMRRPDEGEDPRNPTRGAGGWIPAAAGVLGTVGLFAASYWEIVPLWHRRYFVAAFPLLVWTAGEWVALAQRSFAQQRFAQRGLGQRGLGQRPRTRIAAAAVLVVATLGFQSWYQGTSAAIVQGWIPRQWRGESWREAVDLVRREVGPRDVIWLDSQLIETRFLRHPVAQLESRHEVDWDYLRFPLDGPYHVEPVRVVDCAEHESWLVRQLHTLPRDTESVWLISRSGGVSVDRFIERIGEFVPVEVQRSFSGRPQVIRLRLRDRSRLNSAGDAGEFI